LAVVVGGAYYLLPLIACDARQPLLFKRAA
jgi:hypothetical protein